jgi:ferrochelatase
MTQTGILLLNLGTPDHPDTSSVRRYLKEFLSDPRVIDIPSPARWLLLNAIILPFRSKKSAAAYQQIWSSTTGSPLLHHSNMLQQALSKQLGASYQVALGMRYGHPTIASALEILKDCTRLIILPLFPQYSSAATGSALEKTFSLLSQQWNIPEIIAVGDFYNEAGFIKAYAAIIKQAISSQKIDLLLFSYHGLPERHISKSACVANCTHVTRCPAISPDNQ